MTTASLVGIGTTVGGRTADTPSLQRRLPLLILGLLGIAAATFAWIAYLEVQQALKASAATRMAAAAEQVAELLASSAQARIAEVSRLAADPELRVPLEAGRTTLTKPESPDAAQAFVSRNPLATVWLVNRDDRSARAVAVGAEGQPATPLSPPPAGVSPLVHAHGRTWYYTTVPVSRSRSASDARADSLSAQRLLGSSQAAALIERLIGAGAVLKFGNRSGDVWTDLQAVTAAPPFEAPGIPATYTRTTQDKWMGVAVPAPGTPWLVWVEIAEDTVLEPARVLLHRMVPVTFIVTVLGALAVYTITRRLTKPLEAVAAAADAMAAGDYGRRVQVDRRDEIGRVGTAFNVMAARVAESHEFLERRVADRTRQLEEAREELDRFFSLSLDLLCISGFDGRFRRVNPAWERTLGWTQADLMSAPYLDFVHPDDRALTAAEARKLDQGETTLSFENRYRCRDGAYRWLSWKAVPISSQGLIYAVAHDVTAQRAAERALHRYASELETTNRELESFSYSVSHDLRAPLRHIDGFAQALIEDCSDQLDESGRHFLARIRSGAQRMGTLIDDLLSLSRVTRTPLKRTEVDLSSLARETAARLQADDPGRRVDWRLASGVTVGGDAQLLKIAFDNLLGNAWKFTSKRHEAVIEFSVSVSADGRRIYIVRDNGAGFEMAHAQKLFGAFQRLHGVADFPGTGIGLATVQRIVHRHGGRVWAESAVNQGAAFFFTLEAQ